MKFYTPIELGRMIGITPDALKRWEEDGVVPLARREGRKKRRLWSEAQAYQILVYAESIGYNPRFGVLTNYKGDNSETTSQKEISRQLSLR